MTKIKIRSKRIEKIFRDITAIQIDDVVEPVKDHFQPFEYKGKPISEGKITLLTYHVKTIFPEKLQTIISKYRINSRIKDYHDAILRISEKDLLNLEK